MYCLPVALVGLVGENGEDKSASLELVGSSKSKVICSGEIGRGSTFGVLVAAILPTVFVEVEEPVRECAFRDFLNIPRDCLAYSGLV